jgi:hypothetical protein
MGIRHSFEYDLPGQKVRFDYDTRTDGQPVYKGLTEMGNGDSTPVWRLFKFTYSGDDCVLKESAFGAWDDRAGLFT